MDEKRNIMLTAINEKRNIMLVKLKKYIEKKKKEGDSDLMIRRKIQMNKARWNLISDTEKRIFIFGV